MWHSHYYPRQPSDSFSGLSTAPCPKPVTPMESYILCRPPPSNPHRIISLEKHRGGGRGRNSPIPFPNFLSPIDFPFNRLCNASPATTAHHPPHARGFHHRPLLSP